MTAAGGAVNNNNKKVKFKICAPFTDCFTKKKWCKNRWHPMYNLVGYSDAYSMTWGSLK